MNLGGCLVRVGGAFRESGCVDQRSASGPDGCQFVAGYC